MSTAQPPTAHDIADLIRMLAQAVVRHEPTAELETKLANTLGQLIDARAKQAVTQRGR